MPEPWLWSVFCDLLEAAAAMEKPPAADSQALHDFAPEKPHEFKIHADLKPANILLDYCREADGDDDIMTQYPKALLADFGCAKYSRAAYGDNNPRGVSGALAPLHTILL